MAKSPPKRKPALANRPTAKRSKPTTTKVKTKTKTKTRRAPRPRAKIAPAKKQAPAATPPSRRAIFIDVENTSSEADLMRVIEALKIDRTAQPTELTAVGNWRTVGQRLGRRLAALGAQLVHSAPATGVRDWSDLWIAVAAGCWLGTSAAGDTLVVVSDDRAFDAVGDAAAARGVVFQRVSYRTLPATPEVVADAEPSRHHRTRRGGRRRRTGSEHDHAGRTEPSRGVRSEAAQPEMPPIPRAPSGVSAPGEEAHPASHAQIAAVLARLTGGNPERWVNLDVLANALKAEGFTRPPGSPRLVTRLRRLKDLEVSPNGMVRLVAGPSASISDEAPPASEVVAAPRRRSRRRGGRGRRPQSPTAEQAGAEQSSPDTDMSQQ